MQTNVLWTGREYHSLENCLVTISKNGANINSVIIGSYEGMIYRVDYAIETNKNWETISFEINYRHSNFVHHLRCEGDGKGNWKSAGKPAKQFDGCIDIDIPLTPFTNTLPINRLKLSANETQQIRVIYLDLLKQQITPVRQQYKKLSATKYHYENVPNDFEADIEVDEQGLVVDYPMLFIRTSALKSNYPQRQG
jgi:uncharacterized protein